MFLSLCADGRGVVNRPSARMKIRLKRNYVGAPVLPGTGTRVGGVASDGLRGE